MIHCFQLQMMMRLVFFHQHKIVICVYLTKYDWKMVCDKCVGGLIACIFVGDLLDNYIKIMKCINTIKNNSNSMVQ